MEIIQYDQGKSDIDFQFWAEHVHRVRIPDDLVKAVRKLCDAAQHSERHSSTDYEQGYADGKRDGRQGRIAPAPNDMV